MIFRVGEGDCDNKGVSDGGENRRESDGEDSNCEEEGDGKDSYSEDGDGEDSYCEEEGDGEISLPARVITTIIINAYMQVIAHACTT